MLVLSAAPEQYFNKPGMFAAAAVYCQYVNNNSAKVVKAVDELRATIHAALGFTLEAWSSASVMAAYDTYDALLMNNAYGALGALGNKTNVAAICTKMTPGYIGVAVATYLESQLSGTLVNQLNAKVQAVLAATNSSSSPNSNPLKQMAVGVAVAVGGIALAAKLLK
jgi:hypothetical protein